MIVGVRRAEGGETLDRLYMRRMPVSVGDWITVTRWSVKIEWALRDRDKGKHAWLGRRAGGIRGLRTSSELTEST